MDKLYGYKEKDVVNLIKFIDEKKGKPLTTIFAEYGEKNKKTKGTVRNLYYAIAKVSNKDQEFCDKYLSGKAIEACEIQKFSATQEKELIKKVLIALGKGQSVRNTVLTLANGDCKLALRYQNKYRNALKKSRKEVEEILCELKNEGIATKNPYCKRTAINDFQLIRLKQEIDQMVKRIAQEEKEKNAELEQKICALELENFRLLCKIKESETATKSVANYFLPLSFEKNAKKK